MNFLSFIPEPVVIAQFVVATVILSLTPGPDMMLFIGRALAQGRAAGIACIAGASTGIIIHVILVVVGLSALIYTSPQAFFALKVAGAAYLLWIAFQALRHPGGFIPAKDKEKKTHSLRRDYFTALGVNLLNPKIILFNMTFLPQFVSAHDPHAPGKLLFLGLFFIPVACCITIPMVLAAERFSGFLKRKPRALRFLDWLMAGLFTAFAVRLLTAQVK